MLMLYLIKVSIKYFEVLMFSLAICLVKYLQNKAVAELCQDQIKLGVAKPALTSMLHGASNLIVAHNC